MGVPAIPPRSPGIPALLHQETADRGQIVRDAFGRGGAVGRAKRVVHVDVPNSASWRERSAVHCLFGVKRVFEQHHAAIGQGVGDPPGGLAHAVFSERTSTPNRSPNRDHRAQREFRLRLAFGTAQMRHEGDAARFLL